MKELKRITERISKYWRVSIEIVERDMRGFKASRKRWPNATISPSSNSFGMIIRATFKNRHKEVNIYREQITESNTGDKKTC